jgi:DME family drug/metabolite transporter
MSGSALLALLASCLMWGTTGIVAAGMTTGVSTLAIGSFTMGVGGVILAALTWRNVRHALAIRRARLWVLLGGLGVFVYPLAFYAGMHDAGVAVGNTVALGSGPLFAGVIEWVATKRAPHRGWFVALGIATIGLVCVGVARGGSNSVGFTGVLLAVLAGIAYALYSVAGSRVIAAGADFRGSMGSVFGAGALPLLAVLMTTGLPLVNNPENLIRGAYLALGPLVLAYLLFGYALTRASASLVTLVTLLEPVFATILAVVVLGEALPPVGWFGVGLLVTGVAVATVPRRAADIPKSDPFTR